mmetsp:Transcript_21725/g.76278  ORF Transcript_21725/g.76278 Transcript_21725/m.76278 type:complete len:200 (-) Transcript_21725:1831-2430(-)
MSDANSVSRFSSAVGMGAAPLEPEPKPDLGAPARRAAARILRARRLRGRASLFDSPDPRRSSAVGGGGGGAPSIADAAAPHLAEICGDGDALRSSLPPLSARPTAISREAVDAVSNAVPSAGVVALDVSMLLPPGTASSYAYKSSSPIPKSTSTSLPFVSESPPNLSNGDLLSDEPPVSCASATASGDVVDISGRVASA